MALEVSYFLCYCLFQAYSLFLSDIPTFCSWKVY